MRMEMKKKLIINVAFYGIVLAFFVLTYKYLLPIMLPFVIGFLVASVVRMIHRKIPLKHKQLDKPLSGVLCIAFYAILVGLIALLSTTLVKEVAGFAGALPDLFYEYVYPFIIQVAIYIRKILAPFDESVVEYIMDLGKAVVQSLGQFATNLSGTVVKWIANGAVGVPGLIIEIILTVVSTFYIAADYDMVIGFLTKLIPENKREMTVHTLQYAKHAVAVYIRSYTILFILTFLELTIGLMLLRVPYYAGIALAIAVFDLMPVLGTGGILLPWTVIALVLGNWKMSIGILVLYIVITIVRNSVEPRLVGERIGLHPLATLVAMIVGLRLMGLLGMFCFPVGLVVYTNLQKNKQHA